MGSRLDVARHLAGAWPTGGRAALALLAWSAPLASLAGCRGAASPPVAAPAAAAAAAPAAPAPTAGAPPVTANAAIRTPDSIPTGTAADARALLVDVRSLDSTILVDMRYRGRDNFTGAPLPGYEGNRALLHRDAARALARVQASLRGDGFGLKVFDAYRPVRATLAMVEWTQRTGREALVRDGYISDRSRHNLGVAIDLTLVTLADGRELAMGTPYDTFSAAAHTANATGDVARNRTRLVSAMAREGFANYDQEWWHFSHPATPLYRFDVVITP